MAIARNDNATLFAAGAVSTLRLIVYIAAAGVLMVLDHHRSYLASIRQAAAVVVEPVYRLAALPSEAARAAREAVATRSELDAENRRLRDALLLATTRLDRLDALVAQNAELKDLLDARKRHGLGGQLAHLVDIDLDPFRHRVVLDAGSRQGVSVGQPVIDAHGVMGQVVEVFPGTSVVMLVTDPSHSIPVVIDRTGLRTIARGNGAIDQLVLPYLPLSADVRAGDTLTTSGLGGRFPPGFPVGTVTGISKDSSGLFARATVAPAAGLDRSSEVLLLKDLPEPYGPPDAAPEFGPPKELAGAVPPAAQP